jgi:RimJ/RimL family protein N-acetyltransferase
MAVHGSEQAGLKIEPVTLNGQIVRLEPLQLAHTSQLAQVGLEESIWRHMRYGMIRTEAGLRTWIQELLRLQEQGSDLPFAVIHLPSERSVGVTRYLEIRLEHRALEIGGTWYGLAYQRTAVNTESKYLLLQHAFETLGAIRVQFKTDARNLRSQRSIERIGAVKEGVLRSHMILPDGFVRDTVVYSILVTEWPQIKARLAELLER